MIQGKKILVVTTTDNMIWQFLLPHIEDLKANENNVECACNETGFWFKEMGKSGLKLHKIDFPRNPLSTKLFKAKKQLCNLVKNNHYDLIICHQPVGGVMGRIAGHKYHIPVIYVAHGFHFFKGCPKKNLLYKSIEKHYSRYTDALVTMNEEDYQAALKFKAKRVYKINGIGFDEKVYKKSCEDACESLKNELKIEKDDFVCVSIGELNDNKNHIAVLKAIANIQDRTHLKYFICGEGKKRKEYQKFIIDNNLQNNIKLLGFRKDIPTILSIADCFIMPSKREGLPRSIMEAEVLGLPCIVSDIRGCRDLVIDNKGGVVLDVNDVELFSSTLKNIMKNTEQRKQYGEFNKQFVKDYTLSIVLQQMRKIYEEIEFCG